MRILLSAFGIHKGGGLVLLNALMKELDEEIKIASLDFRLHFEQSSISFQGKVEYVRRSFLARIMALNKLARITSSDDILLCFNSLPPLKKPTGRVIVFVQSTHFIGKQSDVKYNYLISLRHIIERVWFRFGVRNCNQVWVQTPVIRELMLRNYPKSEVKVVPLIDSEIATRLAVQSQAAPNAGGHDSRFVFFYPADAVEHKNHENLLQAWRLLAREGRTPRLILTLRSEEIESLRKRIQLDDHESVSVENLGWLSRDESLAQLRKSSALIFPSRTETFGLPLLEARSLSVPIVASERDFVRQICAPAQTFDPDSPRSIAMAVVRFMDGEIPLTTDYYSAKRFVEELYS